MRQPDYRPRSERLTRDVDHKILGGVCAGIARHYGYDVTLVRVVSVLLTLFWGAGLLVYAVLWTVMPVEQDTGGTIVGSLGDASEDASQSTSSTTAGSGFVNDDLADRARRAAEELAVAARSAAETARVAAEQLSEVAKAAATAGRAAWDEQQQQRAARGGSSESASNTSSTDGTPPPPPMTPPPSSSQTTPLPREDIQPE
jgi:phage shock protein C